MSKSLKQVFVISIVTISVILLGLLTFVNTRGMSTTMEKGIYDTLSARASYEAELFDHRLAEVAGKTEALGLLMTSQAGHDMELPFQYIRNVVADDAIICGSGLWYAPNALPERGKWFGPYFAKGEGDKIEMTMDYSTEEYDYTQYAWYQKSILGDPVVFWDEPAYDPVSDTSMMSSSYPILHDGIVEGVITVDIGLQELEEYVRNIRIGETGYAFIVTQSGKLIAYKDKAMNMSESLQDSQNPELAKMGKDIVALSKDKPLFVTENSALGEDSYIVAAPIGKSGLKLVVVAPVADYSGAITQAIAISVILSLIVIILLCAAMMYVFKKRIDEPIHEIVQGAESIAQGNLNLQLNYQREDEIGTLSASINKMAGMLKDMINDVNNMAQQVSAASEELYATADQSGKSLEQIGDTIATVSVGAKKQEDQVMKSVSAVKDIGGYISNVNAVVNDTMSATGESISAMKANKDSMNQATVQMALINEKIGEAQEAILALGEHSKEISQIVDTISSIASQTNLLALNAAIEAARAGEQGRGFAVVAEEVRKLAEQSQEAAERVAELINTSTVYTDKAVSGMDNSATEVEKGTKVIRDTGELFENLVGHIQHVSDGMGVVSDRMSQIDRINQDILVSSEELKDIAIVTSRETEGIAHSVNSQRSSQSDIISASQNLAELAQDLQRLIGRFKL